MNPQPSNPNDAKRAELDELVPRVYEELRAAARRYLRQQSPAFTLRPTDMVNEAILHMMQFGQGGWQSTEHFRAIATHKIWQVLVDYLKRKYARKRGGAKRRVSDSDEGQGPQKTSSAAADPAIAGAPGPWQRVSIETVAVDWNDRAIDLLDIAEALEALEQESKRYAEIVRLRWFGGLKHQEIADYLGVSLSTVEKDFRYASAWISRRLTESSGGD
jgi:RNA polymerase sigma factor (sigma-70 family)